MKTQINIIIFLLLISIPMYWCECSLKVEKLDKCTLDTMFIGNRDVIIPTNEALMDQYCSKTIEGTKCMKDYADNCMTGFPQQLVQMILGHVGEHIEVRCNKKEQRQEFMDHVKCFDSRDKMEPMHVCSDKQIVMMSKILDMEPDIRIPVGCCTFQNFKNCIISTTKKICGDDTSQYWDDMIQEMADGSVSFACGEYDSSERCDKLMSPEIWTPLKVISDSNDPNVYKHEYKTIIPIALDMIEKFHM